MLLPEPLDDERDRVADGDHDRHAVEHGALAVGVGDALKRELALRHGRRPRVVAIHHGRRLVEQLAHPGQPARGLHQRRQAQADLIDAGG